MQPNGTNTSNRMSSATASVGSTSPVATAGQFKPRNDVKLIEPDIDWSYAVVERQSKENLTTSLLPVQSREGCSGRRFVAEP